MRSFGSPVGCAVALLIAVGVAGLGGCGGASFSSGFSALLDDGSGNFASIDNAPGHVVVAFVNNAEVDELLLSYLESAEGGSLVLTDAQKRELRPRVRVRAQIVFTDGTALDLEFVSGSTELVEPRFAATSATELDQNDRDNAVVACDVARVDIQINTVEVFVPVEWRTFDFVDPTETAPGFLQEIGRQGPEFVQLQIDDIDPDTLTTTLQRNVSTRDLPAPVNNPTCGAVVAIQLNGVLSVPFILSEAGNVPGYDIVDTARAASLGGRFAFQVSIQ